VTAYKIYYRSLTLGANWSAKLHNSASTTDTIRPLYASHTYAIRVVAFNCPLAAAEGESSNTVFGVAPAPTTCSPTPVITAVSNCPNQITVGYVSGTSPQMRLTLRRLTPSYTAGVQYNVSSASVTNFGVGTQYAGSVWEVFAQSVCTGQTGNNLYSPVSNVVYVTVKAACDTPQNLVLSHPTCNGLTAAWNAAACSGQPVVNYQVYIKKAIAANYTSYNVGLADHKTFPYPALSPNTEYNVFVRAVACNGAVGLASPVQSMTTGGVGCRQDDEASEQTPASLVQGGTSVLVYPNPVAQGYFEVDVARSADDDAVLKIELIDALGRTVLTDFSGVQRHANQRVTLPAAIAAGAYLVRVTAGKETFSQRLVVQND
jgi:hypothetical protein